MFIKLCIECFKPKNEICKTKYRTSCVAVINQLLSCLLWITIYECFCHYYYHYNFVAAFYFKVQPGGKIFIYRLMCSSLGTMWIPDILLCRRQSCYIYLHCVLIQQKSFRTRGGQQRISIPLPSEMLPKIFLPLQNKASNLSTTKHEVKTDVSIMLDMWVLKPALLIKSECNFSYSGVRSVFPKPMWTSIHGRRVCSNIRSLWKLLDVSFQNKIKPDVPF